MKSSWLVAGLAVAVACGAAVVVLKDRKSAYSAGPVRAEERNAPPDRPEVPAPPTAEAPGEQASPEVPAEPSAPPPAPTAEQPPEPAAAPQAAAPVVAPVPRPAPAPAADPPAARPAQPKPKQAQKSGKNSVPPAERPLARQALALVGADPAAEAFWVEAINDPTRSTHERKDLIEDLNEEGFDDPKNLTADDLPLIESRLALIEQLAPQAMDDANFAAFAEAYKDLVNMYARVAGR